LLQVLSMVQSDRFYRALNQFDEDTVFFPACVSGWWTSVSEMLRFIS
jgi:hypothetical protein